MHLSVDFEMNLLSADTFPLRLWTYLMVFRLKIYDCPVLFGIRFNSSSIYDKPKEFFPMQPQNDISTD